MKVQHELKFLIVVGLGTILFCLIRKRRLRKKFYGQNGNKESHNFSLNIIFDTSIKFYMVLLSVHTNTVYFVIFCIVPLVVIMTNIRADASLIYYMRRKLIRCEPFQKRKTKI